MAIRDAHIRSFPRTRESRLCQIARTFYGAKARSPRPRRAFAYGGRVIAAQRSRKLQPSRPLAGRVATRSGPHRGSAVLAQARNDLLAQELDALVELVEAETQVEHDVIDSDLEEFLDLLHHIVRAADDERAFQVLPFLE